MGAWITIDNVNRDQALTQHGFSDAEIQQLAVENPKEAYRIRI